MQLLHHVCIFYSVAYSIIICTFWYYSIYEYSFLWLKLPDLLLPFWPFLRVAFQVRREPDSSQLFHPSFEICQSCTCKLVKNDESFFIFQSFCIHYTRHFNVQSWFKYHTPDYRNLPVTRYFSAPKLNVQSNPKLDKIVQFSFYFVWKSLNSEHLKSTFSLKSSPQLQS